MDQSDCIEKKLGIKRQRKLRGREQDLALAIVEENLDLLDWGKGESGQLVDIGEEEKEEEEEDEKNCVEESDRAPDSRKSSTKKTKTQESTTKSKTKEAPVDISTPPLRQRRARQQQAPPTPKGQLQSPTSIPRLLTTTPKMPPTTTSTIITPLIRLLVCSIGNPAPYTNTLHSTGHILLSALQSHHSHTYPPFQKSKSHANGLLSSSRNPSIPITLYQSPALMNVSGIPVIAAYREFLQAALRADAGEEGVLVIVHDELELPLGEVRLKSGRLSVKGHNGLKSVRERLAAVGLDVQGRGTVGRGAVSREWVRIGVGIGRPESRERGDVARYVLGKMSTGERGRIEGAVEGVIGLLEGLVSGGRR